MPATNQTQSPGERPWTAAELEHIRSTGEVHVSSRRDDPDNGPFINACSSK